MIGELEVLKEVSHLFPACGILIAADLDGDA